jgi:hypothetical protein
MQAILRCHSTSMLARFLAFGNRPQRLTASVSIIAGLVLFGSALAGLSQGTVTSVPADGATDVSPSAAVIFTFSAAVDPTSANISFFTTSPPGAYPVNSVWSSGNTVVTCTPISPFPGDTAIQWFVFAGTTFGSGSFTTGAGTGGGGGGTGTNAITTFAVGKLYFYEQTNNGPATPTADYSYFFNANAALASNRSATSVTVTIPGSGSPTGLTQNFLHHEDYYFVDFGSNQANFEATYPQGSYAFNVIGSNLQGTVTMPLNMAQPNAPHVPAANFDAAQTIDASKSFTLMWDAFQSGTASDYIGVSVSLDDTTNVVFQTPGPGTNGALTGTALSTTIPVGKLIPGTNYTTIITFYHWIATTNTSPVYASVAYRATGTQLGLVTTNGVVSVIPVVSNPTWSTSGLGFDVATSLNQALNVLYTTNFVDWQLLYTTNSPGTSVHITVPEMGPYGFVRIQNKP